MTPRRADIRRSFLGVAKRHGRKVSPVLLAIPLILAALRFRSMLTLSDGEWRADERAWVEWRDLAVEEFTRIDIVPLATRHYDVRTVSERFSISDPDGIRRLKDCLTGINAATEPEWGIGRHFGASRAVGLVASATSGREWLFAVEFDWKSPVCRYEWRSAPLKTDDYDATRAATGHVSTALHDVLTDAVSAHGIRWIEAKSKGAMGAPESAGSP